MVTKKFSAITSGGSLAPATDQILVVRSGTTDLLVTAGTAAVANTGTSGASVPLLNAANTFSGITTFSTDILNTSLAASAATSCGVIYVGTTGKLEVDQNDLVWDDTNKRLGIFMNGSVPSAALDVHGTGSHLIKCNNVGVQGAGAGGGILSLSDPGAAMASGSRLGFLAFGGTYDTSHGIRVPAILEAVTTELWSNTANGTKLVFATTANGSTIGAPVLILDQDRSAVFYGTISATNLSGTNTGDETISSIISKRKLSLAGNNCNISQSIATNTSPIHNTRSKHKTPPSGMFLKNVVWVNGYLTTNGEVQGFFDYELRGGIFFNNKYSQVTFAGGALFDTASKVFGTSVGNCGVWIPGNTEYYICTYRKATDAAASVTTISAITRGATTVITYTGVDPSANGNLIRFESIGGTTQLNWLTNGNVDYMIANLNTSAKTFEIQTSGGVAINSSGFGAYTSGGLGRRVYSWHYNTGSGFASGLSGSIFLDYVNDADYSIGVGLPGGISPASVLPLTPANFTGSALSSATKGLVGSAAVGGAGALYTTALSLYAYYGAAGANQPGSQYPGSGINGYTNMASGLVSTISVSAGGTGHDTENPPLLFVAGGGGYGGSGGVCYGPQAILGYADDPSIQSILLEGDSIMTGFSSADTTGDLYGNYGCYEQAIANRAGTMKFAVNGESAAGWLLNNSRRLAFLTVLNNLGLRIDSVVIGLGVNDFFAFDVPTAVSDLATRITSMISTYKSYGIGKCFTTTVTPSVTGTFTTLVGQTANAPTNNFGAAGRVLTYNDGIRNGSLVPTQDGYIDLATVVSDPTTPWKFRVDGQFYLQYSTGVAFTTDGTHPNLGAGIPYAARYLDVRALGIKDAPPYSFNSSGITPIYGNTGPRIPRKGEIGETIKGSLASGSATSLVNGTAKTICSFILNEGIWLIFGKVDFLMNSANATQFEVGYSQVNNTFGNDESHFHQPVNFTGSSQEQSGHIPTGVVTVPAGQSKTFYLIASATFGSGTITAYGQIYATRFAKIL